MKIQVIDEENVIEPISVEEVKSYSNLDLDYEVNDEDIKQSIRSARVRVEQFLNVGLVRRKIEVQFSGCHQLALPLSPTGEIESVKRDGVLMNPDDYLIDQFRDKTIYLQPGGEDYGQFFYFENGAVEYTSGRRQNKAFYSVVYTTGYLELPGDIKLALKAEVDYLIKLKGDPEDIALSSTAFALVRGYSKNPIL